jgi:hypothetical protein
MTNHVSSLSSAPMSVRIRVSGGKVRSIKTWKIRTE